MEGYEGVCVCVCDKPFSLLTKEPLDAHHHWRCNSRHHRHHCCLCRQSDKGLMGYMVFLASYSSYPFSALFGCSSIYAYTSNFPLLDDGGSLLLDNSIWKHLLALTQSSRRVNECSPEPMHKTVTYMT